MNQQQRKLLVEQLDKKISCFSDSAIEGSPGEGWIYSIRKSLNMTLLQLSKKLNKTIATTKEIEEREKNKNITLKKLEEVAEALEMKFVYGFVPKGGSIKKHIKKRAFQTAEEIIRRASQTMKLEGQETSDEYLRETIKTKAKQLARETPKYLWD
jgi:predicted DNA-binding mobile mystery protein A